MQIGLNKEQTQAIRHNPPDGGGPLLIIAGAGTGKTTVITERIKFLIEKGLAKPSEILALTFTEKASREMEERVDIALPYGYTQMWISTFHSFCDRILRAEALQIGLNPTYKLTTEAEAIQFIRRNLFKFNLDYFRPLGNPTKFISGMLQHFSRLQDEDISPTEYISWAQKQKGSRKKVRASHGAKSSRDDSVGLESLPTESKVESQKWMELASAYKAYSDLKAKEGMMDFGDLIIKTLELFRSRPNVLKVYRKQFKYVLVDEFQDTNVAQYELLKLLIPPSKKANLTVVGDDSQSIYKFRGAAISNIIYFQKDYKSAKTIVLTKNYRSSQTILDSAYNLIQHNNPDTLEVKLGIDKNLISMKKRGLPAQRASSPEGELVKFLHLNRVENEADEVAREIHKLTVDSLQTTENHKAVGGSPLAISYSYSDIAILVRANNHSEPFIRALSRHGVPYQFLGPGRLFKQSEIIDLIAYLKVLYDIDDSVAFYRLLCIDHFELEAKDVVRISNYARRQNMSLFEVCSNLDEVFVGADTKKQVGKLVDVVNRHLKLIKKDSAGQLLYYFLVDMDLIQKLLNPDNPEAEKKAKNISKFFDKLKTYEVDHEDASVGAVVDWIELASELGESPLAANEDWTSINAVNILTVHSAKGLEFPVVFLVNLVSQRFPSTERHEQIPIPDDLIKEVLPVGDFHTQEERRLFYVGMTRAKERLYITAADYYGEGKREKKLSPFIFEALGDAAVSAELKTEDSKQLSFLDYKSHQKEMETGKLKIENRTHIDYLSYSQIESFRICPLHYKLSYIVKVPTPPSASLSFGTTIHAAVKEFYEKVKTGEFPSEKLMQEVLKNNWVNDGYLSKDHEKKFFDKGKIYLTGFLKEEFSAKKLPQLMEQRFMLPLPCKKGERPLKIGGVFDRVDVVGDTIEIMDYKTGANIPTQKEADSNLQLTLYALAASSITEPPFAKKPEDIKLALYYFDNQEKLVTTRTQNQLNTAINEIYDIRRQIEESDFHCSGNMLCETCEYKLFCGSDE